MLHDWGVIAAAFGYIGFLFLVASYGDRLSPDQRGRASGLIYPLSLAIYCTSWTYFGSVGSATRTSVDFLAIYVGPVLMIGLCTPLLRRVIQLAKTQNITSIADFIGARYGKSQAVAVTVAMIAIIGSVPYIALQLKAVASSLEIILSEDRAISRIPIIGDIPLLVTLAMAAFAVLFGTRQTDATEHQHGLMLAVATESMVKLVAFLAAGVFVTFWMFTPHELAERALKTPEAVRAIDYVPSAGNFLITTLLSFCAIMLLPRQFHVSVVENASDAEVGRARWLFPLYLVTINLFVIPIALAGLITFPFGRVDSDVFVLALPIAGNAPALAMAVFVGGLSAGTAMVIVECVALSVMVSNDMVVPLVLHRARPQPLATSCSRCGALRSSPSWRWPIFITAPSAIPSSPRSGCCRLRQLPSSRRRFSAAWSGVAAPRAAPSAACWSAAWCGCTRYSCQASWTPIPRGSCCCSTGRSASRRCGHRRCSAPTCRPCCTGCSGAWRSTSRPSCCCRCGASPPRSSGCRPTCSCRANSRRPRRASAAGAPRSPCRTSSRRSRNISAPSAPGNRSRPSP
jgi:Na+/proline symporter